MTVPKFAIVKLKKLRTLIASEFLIEWTLEETLNKVTAYIHKEENIQCPVGGSLLLTYLKILLRNKNLLGTFVKNHKK